jgi:hypothetical protein
MIFGKMVEVQARIAENVKQLMQVKQMDKQPEYDMTGAIEHYLQNISTDRRIMRKLNGEMQNF